MEKNPTPAQLLKHWLAFAESNRHVFSKELPDGARKWCPLVEKTRAALAEAAKENTA